MVEIVDWDTGCDACDKRATKKLCAETSPYCANWFIGYYCDDCYVQVETHMKELTDANDQPISA